MSGDQQRGHPLRGQDRERGVDFGRLKTREGRLPRFERADHTIQTRQVGHSTPHVS